MLLQRQVMMNGMIMGMGIMLQFITQKIPQRQEQQQLNGTVASGDTYIWVPRYGLYEEELAYCYGTSSYKITYSLFDSVVYLYGLTGIGSDGTYTVDTISAYVSSTFEENDGLSGVWYSPNGTNDTATKNAYAALNSYVAISNFQQF